MRYRYMCLTKEGLLRFIKESDIDFEVYVSECSIYVRRIDGTQRICKFASIDKAQRFAYTVRRAENKRKRELMRQELMLCGQM